MRIRLTLGLVLVMNLTGCVFMETLVHNVISAPRDHFSEVRYRARMRHMARALWAEIAKAEKQPCSKSFARGFEDGFVDYADSNGNGEPPAMPPHDLWRKELNQLSGSAEIEDWYAGFRHGAAEAKAQGVRERVLIPVGRPPQSSSPLPEFHQEFTAPTPAPVGEAAPK